MNYRANVKLKAAIRAHLIDGITCDGYDDTEDINTIPKKVQWAEKTFIDEFNFNISRYGKANAAISWLQGLPSAVSTYFYNEDILYFAEAIGYFNDTRKSDRDKQEDLLIKEWFPMLGVELVKLFDQYRIAY